MFNHFFTNLLAEIVSGIIVVFILTKIANRKYKKLSVFFLGFVCGAIFVSLIVYIESRKTFPSNSQISIFSKNKFSNYHFLGINRKARLENFLKKYSTFEFVEKKNGTLLIYHNKIVLATFYKASNGYYYLGKFIAIRNKDTADFLRSKNPEDPFLSCYGKTKEQVKKYIGAPTRYSADSMGEYFYYTYKNAKQKSVNIHLTFENNQCVYIGCIYK